jgi:hypothetical protein
MHPGAFAQKVLNRSSLSDADCGKPQSNRSWPRDLIFVQSHQGYFTAGGR